MKISWMLVVLVFSCGFPREEQKVQVRTVAFYNLENLFDTKDNPHTWDNDFTSNGKYHWTEEQYHQKIENLARVIAEIGQEATHNVPDVIGVAEVENADVLRDLVAHPVLASAGYSFVHQDSRDRRGIDVALIYKKSVFRPLAFRARNPHIVREGKEIRTRDILIVTGEFQGENVSFVVNHWPSRLGGKKKSDTLRMQAAAVNRIIFDSLRKVYPEGKVIGMGDLNDNPSDKNVKEQLQTISNPNSKKENAIYNPMEAVYQKGVGTLFYRGKPFLFDQIFFSNNLLKKEGFYYFQRGIFNPPKLSTPNGELFRSFKNKRFTGGYSDHFPVYILLVRKRYK